MDLSKLGSNLWSDTGRGGDTASVVQGFLQDVQDTKALSDQRVKVSRSTPQFVGGTAQGAPTMTTGMAASMPTLPQLKKTADTTGSPARKTKRAPMNPMRKPPPGVSYAVMERPANRAEIEALDRELEERIKVVLYRETTELHAVESGDLYQPHKDAIILIRDSMLDDFGVGLNGLAQEQWLDKLIKCECLRTVCDHVASVLNDMLSVSSSELGSVLRKLRFTYKQAFDQMHVSARQLHYFYVDTRRELEGCRKELAAVRQQLSAKDDEMHRNIDREVSLVRSDFMAQREADQDTVAQTEHQMAQMAETLRSLNGIFKAMQADGSAARTADLVNRAQKLEKENVELAAKCGALDETRAQLAAAEAQVAFLEAERLHAKARMDDMERELQRRESVVAMLMEKDALRTAELEKMQRQEEAKRHKETIDVSAFEEAPTAVLCIRCKRSLDDLSNIRAAVYGYGGAGLGKKKQCEAFRSLLPNLKGRRPARNLSWLRTSMRSILLAKMREDVSLLQIKGEISRFPHFVYAWFDQHAPSGSSGVGPKMSSAEMAAAQAQADEDRWGLYYGVKALAKDDPEAQVFWGLLDEAHGEDGQQYLVHCLSIALSLGGAQLWYQLGWPLFQVGGMASMNEVLALKGWHEVHLKAVVWFDVETCKEVVRMVLVRALKAQVGDAIEAVEALKAVPEVDDPLVAEPDADADADAPRKGRGRKGGGQDGGKDRRGRKAVATDPSVLRPSADATHINLFMWLRVMLQQLQAEQIHRSAATTLMFESAAAGALTQAVAAASAAKEKDGGGEGGQPPVGEGAHHAGDRPNSVEYPQFQAICRTLFPSAGTLEIAALFSQCREEGKHRQGVTADVFMRVADLKGMFSRSLRLAALPVLEGHSPVPYNKTAIKPAKAATGEDAADADDAGTGEGEGDDGSVNATEEGATAFAVAGGDAGGEDGALDAGGLPKAPPLTAAKRETLRVRLGALVHRKLAAIMPDIQALAMGVPEKWRALLLDAAAQAQASVGETLDRNKKGVRGPPGLAGGAGRPGTEGGPSLAGHLYIDGLQPFVHYRRLLSLALMVRSLTDNPLLPTELFAGRHRQFSGDVDLGLRQAETLLSNLEAGIVAAAGPAADPSGLGPHTGHRTPPQQQHALALTNPPTGGRSGLPWSIKFDVCRRKLVARRLQAFVRACLYHASVTVPRPVRALMRAGYVRGTRGLRHRAVLREPWWAAAQVAEVYAFKVAYDAKACRLGLPPLPLGEAVCALNFARFGVVDVAERETHDLFFTARAYLSALPRVRLFAAFLGVRGSGEFEEVAGQPSDDDRREAALVEGALQTPHAVALYLDLLVEVHREVAATSAWKQLLKQQQHRALGSAAGSAEASVAEDDEGADPAAADEEDEDDEDGDGSRVRRRLLAPLLDPMQLHAMALPLVLPAVDVLFPSTESAFQRMDRRDVWLLEKDVLKRAARRWAQLLRAQLGANPLAENAMGAFFEDLPELLRAGVGGEVDVDDFLYLAMVQWAKLAAATLAKTDNKVAWAEKNNPAARAAVAAAASALAAQAPDFGFTAQQPQHPSVAVPSRGPPHRFNAHFLRQFVDSMYFLQLPGEGGGGGGGGGAARFVAPGTAPPPPPPPPVLLSDPSSQAALYLRMVVCRARRDGDTTTVGADAPQGEVLDAFLRQNALWDLNSGDGQPAEAQLLPADAAVAAAASHRASVAVAPGTPLASPVKAAPAAPASPSGSVASASESLAGFRAGAAGPSNKDAANRLYSLRSVGAAVAPEVALMAAKETFVAYQDVLAAKLVQVTRRQAAQEKDRGGAGASVAAVAADIERLTVRAGKLMAEFTDKLSWIDSLVIVGPKAGGSAGSVAAMVSHETDRRESEKRTGEARRCWALLQAVLCTMHELVALAGDELPRDPWEAGRKIYVERASVYSIPLQKKVT